MECLCVCGFAGGRKGAVGVGLCFGFGFLAGLVPPAGGRVVVVVVVAGFVRVVVPTVVVAVVVVACVVVCAVVVCVEVLVEV
ncbi:MAG TPA: hypothetical protein VGU02_16755, partial [Gaiellaceae bacterium]|nr:hypothetical protein [Gaiellaceae bacterium]